jgi:hypothetical protein
VWCRPVVKCTTWYNSGDMKLWYVVQGKDSRTVTAYVMGVWHRD